MTRSSTIWMVTIARAGSVLGVMSPNPTVDRIVTAKYSPCVRVRVASNDAGFEWDMER